MSAETRRFSNIDRADRLSTAVDKSYDLIVIGGGITGAGIALDASLRGLKVILIEKNDFAAGTSSKSTKLVHGGLRYLKQFEFSLVRETGTERIIAHNNACHLVHPENMVLPIVEDGTFSSFSASIAISVYDRLAGVSSEQRRRNLSKEETEELEPLLNKDILKSSILYSEYRTDDARLTMELIKAAKRNGAEAFNYLEVTGFDYEQDKVVGTQCYDYSSGKAVGIKAKVIVNAAGPWVDKLRVADKPDTETNLRLSKGSHIVLDKRILNITNAIYFDAFDGRMIFAIPRGEAVYVGTTDTFYHDDLDQVQCNKEDAEYLLKAIRGMFDIPAITIEDIKSTWAGLRPLIKKKGKSASELSRKDEIFVADSGLISIAGGKLTGFRKMAERVVDLVIDSSGRESVACSTKEYKIHAQPFENYVAYLSEIDKIKAQYSQYDAAELSFLVTSYGKDAHLILESASNNYGGNLLKAHVYYTIEQESVSVPLDFLERRTGWLYFDIEAATKYASEVISYFKEAFVYDQAWADEQLSNCHKVIDIHSLKAIKETSLT